MNKKTILILGGIAIIILLCCCLVTGGAMLFNYTNGQNTALLSIEEQTEAFVITVTPFNTLATQQTEPVSNENYATQVGTQLVNCGEKIGDFTEIAIRLNENVNLILNADYIAEVNQSVDQIELYCTDIGKKENVPEQYTDVNEELLLADVSMGKFVENMHAGIDDLDIDAISQALQNLASASNHYDQASLLLKE